MITLPAEVITAIRQGRKVEAIKLLRELEGLDLKTAKEQVEAWQDENPHAEATPAEPVSVVERQSRGRSTYSYFDFAVFIVTLCAFVWMMIGTVAVVGSLIIINSSGNYKQGEFVIEKVFYHDDSEAGLSWGFTGTINSEPSKLLAPEMLDAKETGYPKLRQIFPAGSTLPVLYNMDVTDTLFQDRTLNVVTYTDNLEQRETDRIFRWIKTAVVPFIVLYLISLVLHKKYRQPKQNDLHPGS